MISRFPRFFVCLLAASATAVAAEDAPRQPNVIVILSDTVRADHCSAYGYARDTTPTMERLAREGALYKNHFVSSGWTFPSIFSLFTGLSPVRHSMYDDKCVLPKGTPTIASHLAARGYSTIGVTCNIYSSGKFGFAEGFGTYDDFTVWLDFEMNLFAEDRPMKPVFQSVTSQDLVKIALRYVDQTPKDKPYFLFLLLFDPHTDYTPPPEYAERYWPDDLDFDPRAGYINHHPEKYVFTNPRDLEQIIALYDGEIRYTDASSTPCGSGVACRTTTS